MHRNIRQLVLVAGSIWLVGCASAQRPYNSQDALSPEERRLQSVEDKVAVVNRRLDAIDSSQRGANISDEIRDLRGQVQELQHEQDQQKATLQTLDQRLQQLEPGGTTPPGSAGSSYGAPAYPGAASPSSSAGTAGSYGGTAAATAAPGQPTAQAPAPQYAAPSAPAGGNNATGSNANNPDEQAAYIRSFNLLQAGKMDDAVTGFKAMLNQYPQGNYADNAWYWLGSAYYVKGDSSDALSSYDSLLSKFPNSPKVPDALLKMGVIYQSQNKSTQARSTFRRVISSYPNSNAAAVAKQQLAKNPG